MRIKGERDRPRRPVHARDPRQRRLPALGVRRGDAVPVGPGRADHADAGLPDPLLRAGVRPARPPAGLDPRRRASPTPSPGCSRRCAACSPAQPSEVGIAFAVAVRADRRLRGLGAPRTCATPRRRVDPRAMIELATGAEARVTNPGGRKAVVCVNGGRGKEVPGTWASTLEWLVGRLGPAVPGARVRRGALPDQVVEAADWCIDDCRAAIDARRGGGRRRGRAARLLDWAARSRSPPPTTRSSRP